jgi:hypothetical protein
VPAPAVSPEAGPEAETAGGPDQPAAEEQARTGERKAALRVEAMLVELAVVEHRSPVPPALARLVGAGPLGKLALGGGALVALLTLLVAGLSVLGLFV